MNLTATHNEVYGPRSRACMVAVAVESTLDVCCTLSAPAGLQDGRSLAGLID
jgi:hypothetical protein